jgi:diketogulonate reductase-like aldo/keto reductase
MNLIDTAELYGNGVAEEIVGEAIAGRRNEAFLVSKVRPEHASREGTIKACEGSLSRLKVEKPRLLPASLEGGTIPSKRRFLLSRS